MSHRNPFPGPAAGAALALLAAPAAAQAVEVRWRGEDVAFEAIRAELGPNPATAAESWAPFAAEHGYRLFLDDPGRVLLLVPERNRSARTERALVAETVAFVDELLPAPPEEAAPEEPDEPGDPGGEGGGDDDDAATTWRATWSWGAGAWSRDAETAVLLQARDEADYGRALEHLAERFDYLAGWVEAARSYAGCTLQRPLAAIWLLEGEGLEEYDPENELVHRLAELLILRRFDRQPAWLLQGLAWYVEEELQGSLYCFPWRFGFVYAEEHTSWERALKEHHRAADDLALADVVGLERDAFDLELARNAWGAAAFLARHHAEALPALLEDLRALREEKGVIRHPDGTWERVPGWEPAPADTAALLERHAGPDVLEELFDFYRRGKAYRPPR